MLRALTLAAGLSGAATLSQFPEFSQQYTQRLGGAVDALAQVVADFDTSAQAVGLSRDAALTQMQGSPFLERRRADMTATIMRFEHLSADLRALEGQGPFTRAYNLRHFTDPQIAQAAWCAYQPALPLNFAGLSFAFVGFVLGAALLAGLRALLRWPFGRRPASNPA